MVFLTFKKKIIGKTPNETQKIIETLDNNNKWEEKSCKRGKLNFRCFACTDFPSPSCSLLPTHRLKHPPLCFSQERNRFCNTSLLWWALTDTNSSTNISQIQRNFTQGIRRGKSAELMNVWDHCIFFFWVHAYSICRPAHVHLVSEWYSDRDFDGSLNSVSPQVTLRVHR